MNLYELAPDVLLAAEDGDDAVAVIREDDPQADFDDDDPAMADSLILIRTNVAHKRGVLDERATAAAYQHLRETILR